MTAAAKQNRVPLVTCWECDQQWQLPVRLPCTFPVIMAAINGAHCPDCGNADKSRMGVRTPLEADMGEPR